MLTKNDITTSDFSISVEKPQKKVSIESSHDDSPETDCATVDNKGGVVEFSYELICLGSIINLVLNDKIDTESRVHESSESVVTLRFIWEDGCILLAIEANSYDTISLTLLSWRGDN